MTEFETTVCGIPCIIRVLSWDEYRPAYLGGAPENCYPAEGGSGDFEILDRKGYRAKWLEKKLTARDEDAIQELIYDHMEND